VASGTITLVVRGNEEDKHTTFAIKEVENQFTYVQKPFPVEEGVKNIEGLILYLKKHHKVGD